MRLTHDDVPCALCFGSSFSRLDFLMDRRLLLLFVLDAACRGGIEAWPLLHDYQPLDHFLFKMNISLLKVYAL